MPFYYVRLDQAGNISKGQSATAFHFARTGGACPSWQVHEAFAQPGRILTQVAQMPDGARFFGIARTIEGGGGGVHSRRKLFAIGPGCRVCPHEDCVQRAFPPVCKVLQVDANAESLVSYRFASM